MQSRNLLTVYSTRIDIDTGRYVTFIKYSFFFFFCLIPWAQISDKFPSRSVSTSIHLSRIVAPLSNKPMVTIIPLKSNIYLGRLSTYEYLEQSLHFPVQIVRDIFTFAIGWTDMTYLNMTLAIYTFAQILTRIKINATPKALRRRKSKPFRS